MAVFALAMAGCSNDENEVNNAPVEIRLTSGVAVQARANTQAEQILVGEKVYAWVDKVPAVSYIDAWTLTADGNGNFTGSSQYYPTDNSNLNFYALHGNFTATFTENSTAFPDAPIVHSVEADQSGTDRETYAKSDLLYAIKTGVERSSNAVELEFYHILSKVEVALKSGEGSPDLTGAVVTIEGTQLKADFTPGKEADMTVQTARAAMIAVNGDADNAVAPITIETVITTDFTTNTAYGEAVLLSNQTIAQDATFIKVTLADGGVFNYKVDDTGGLALESGKKYTYQITVNQTGLEVTSKIQDWAQVNKEGDATMD